MQSPITREIVAQQLAAWLEGHLERAALVDWAERAVMDGTFDDADAALLTDVLAQVGLADRSPFALQPADYVHLLERFGGIIIRYSLLRINKQIGANSLKCGVLKGFYFYF